jgi:hypothetical protein
MSRFFSRKNCQFLKSDTAGSVVATCVARDGGKLLLESNRGLAIAPEPALSLPKSSVKALQPPETISTK